MMDIGTAKAIAPGVDMPALGLGVYKVENGQEAYRAVRFALDAGYRLIDTASFYFNEESVGEAIRDSLIPREKLFITTKLWPLEFGDAQKAAAGSLKRLGCGYIDLYLLHWPGLDTKLRLRAWEEVQELKDKGKIRACGVSNFFIRHLEELKEHGGATPANDQVELHPWLQQRGLRDYCAKNGISVTAWGPIFHGHLAEEPLVREIGGKYGKTPAQATLRWHLQKGINVIPKSVHKSRIEENADLFDFSLSEEDMKRIDGLDKGMSFGRDPDVFDGHID